MGSKINGTTEAKQKIPQSVQRHVCFINVQSYLHEHVLFSIWALMCNAAWYHFRLNISCGVAVTVKSYQKKSR